MSSPAADQNALPTVYIFYGDNDFGIETAIAEMYNRFPDETSASMNTARFSGRSLDMGRLIEAASSAPFLADRRLVVVDEVGKLLSSADARSQLFERLEQVPDSTALVLIDRHSFRLQRDFDRYHRRSHLLAWAKDHPEISYTRCFRQPTSGAFVRWISQRATELNGDIDGQAAQTLAEYVAEDSYLADQELHKLLDYVDYQRAISADDVERLSPLYAQTSIFDMVDALGGGEAQHALRLYHQVLGQDDPRYAFAMIVRQFRLLLQARAALDSGQDPVDVLGGPKFVRRKIAAQARRFELGQLESVYQRLIELDIGSKIGRADLVIGMQQLIIELAA